MKQIDIKQLRFITYLRKSSDSEDKQVASIPQQRKELSEFAKREGLKVVEIIEETHTAFEPGRPQFNRMMQMIDDGKADAVLAWNATRISRNSLDGGLFIYKIDQGKIKAFKTRGNTYYNTPEDKFALNIDFTVAKKSSDDLSEAVLRGNRYKFNEKREWGGVAKPGYLNKLNPLTKEAYIDTDPERFPLIQKAFELIIKKMYTPMQALVDLNNRCKYKTRRTKKLGGRPMSKASFYRMLSDSYYCGIMKRKVDGEYQEIKGSHKAMMNEKEFEQLQIRLGKKGKPRYSKKEFAYKEVLKCAECEGSITAEEKWQIICPNCKTKFHKGLKANECPDCHTLIENMQNPKILHYVFYHCTKRVHPNCSQGSITLDDLETEITNKLGKFEIDEGFRDWAINYLNELNDHEETSQTAIKSNLLTQVKDVDSQLRNLLRLRISPQNVNSDPEQQKYYSDEEKRLLSEKKAINKEVEKVDKRLEEWFVQSKETFDFACSARYQFATGDAKVKTYVLSKLGSNLTIKGKKLCISGDKPYFLIEKGKKEIADIVASLEPAKQLEIASHLLGFEPISSAWRRGWDSNPR
ncbi:MAG: recombinase family protein [Candidatus Levyibacteriota bacterium]|nr:MAG: recombinase family protein [Candidatus Levybacteria bacterium]